MGNPSFVQPVTGRQSLVHLFQLLAACHPWSGHLDKGASGRFVET
jgi:hypothetical protein